VIINVWITGRYLMVQPARNAQVIFNVLSDYTLALSWIKHSACTKRTAVRNLARFFQAMLTHCPLPVCLQGKHLPGKERIIADLLSRFLLALSWGSVIEQTSPTLDRSRPCRVPRVLLSKLARLRRSDANVEMSAATMMQLWTLELELLKKVNYLKRLPHLCCQQLFAPSIRCPSFCQTYTPYPQFPPFLLCVWSVSFFFRAPMSEIADSGPEFFAQLSLPPEISFPGSWASVKPQDATIAAQGLDPTPCGRVYGFCICEREQKCSNGASTVYKSGRA